MSDVQQVVIDTLAQRALGVLSESVIQVGMLLLAASVLAMLWTGYRKAEFVALLGEKALEDPKVRWRLRSFAFNVGTAVALVLLAVFLPPLLDPALPLWLRIVARIGVGGVLAPAAGLLVHPLWLLWVTMLLPLGRLLFKGVLDRMATWSARRKASARVDGEGNVSLKAAADETEANPKTEMLGTPRRPD